MPIFTFICHSFLKTQGRPVKLGLGLMFSNFVFEIKGVEISPGKKCLVSYILSILFSAHCFLNGFFSKLISTCFLILPSLISMCLHAHTHRHVSILDIPFFLKKHWSAWKGQSVATLSDSGVLKILALIIYQLSYINLLYVQMSLKMSQNAISCKTKRLFIFWSASPVLEKQYLYYWSCTSLSCLVWYKV